MRVQRGFISYGPRCLSVCVATKVAVGLFPAKFSNSSTLRCRRWQRRRRGSSGWQRRSSAGHWRGSSAVRRRGSWFTTNAQLDSALKEKKKSEKQKIELLKAQINFRVHGYYEWARDR